MLEMGVIMGNLFHQYQLVLDDAKMHEGLLTKEGLGLGPTKCCIGMKRRF